jgi:dipeptidyl aminopeptidase/acylaminoacyl peptidase
VTNIKKKKTYGLWQSKITSDDLTVGSCRLSHLVCDGDDLYWSEGRPSEGGRTAIVKKTKNEISDVITYPFSASSKVHEYGGGEFCVKNGFVYFVNKEDQAIYKTDGINAPVQLTPSDNRRYADLFVDVKRGQVVAVCETHEEGALEPKNSIVSIDCDATGSVKTLQEGADFYMSPKVSYGKNRICWVEWNHPNLPWDNTKLYIAKINEDGSLGEKKIIAGENGSSVVQPKWDREGNLYFVDDVSGWWNLYKWDGGASVENVYSSKREFALPAWVFGQSTYGFDSKGNVITAYKRQGVSRLGILDVENKQMSKIDVDVTHIEKLVVCENDDVYIIAGSGDCPLAVQKVLSDDEKLQIIKKQSDFELPKADVSYPQKLEFRNRDGNSCYGYLYLPTNSKYDVTTDELPPLLVKTHGGPTGATEAVFNLKIQYWTSRGFAVFDINYSGSTGYGTEYRKRLEGNWGVLDVDDCEDAVKFLADEKIIDRDKVAISGGSAGGYTTLCALTFTNSFKAGASYYGVSDVLSLMEETHKFEANYDVSMFGKENAKEIMKKRSPINYTEKLSCPIIFFQGLKDSVVPPSQSVAMVNALKEKGIDTEYITYEEEGHGFRGAETIKSSIEAELNFFVKHLGLK